MAGPSQLYNIEAVRAAIGKFVDEYNEYWRPEKLEFKTPLEARQEHVLRRVA